MKFKDKVVLITGAARGIGKEIALSFAKEGAYVILFDILDEVFNTAKEIEGFGVKAIACRGDASNKKDVETCVAKALEVFNKVDILVNNVGIYPIKPFLEMEEEEWDKVFNVNVKSAFYFTKAVLPIMIRNGFGRIVNISSIAGAVVGFPGLTHYSASKAALVGFTKALALEVAQFNITVNAVAPGPIETPGALRGATPEQLEIYRKLIPVGRIGKPLDVANIVLFLATEEASFITGQLIVVDGGYTIH
ncbi:MAG: SDR family NAD(P)-dependent oxidoreductase [Ignisphaera sp.]